MGGCSKSGASFLESMQLKGLLVLALASNLGLETCQIVSADD